MFLQADISVTGQSTTKAKLDVVEAQRDLQLTYPPSHYPYPPGQRLVTSRHLTECVRFNREATDAEHQEVMQLLPWKRWKRDDRERFECEIVSRKQLEQLRAEHIDKLFFWLNDAIAFGFRNWDEVIDAYETKRQENLRRIADGY